MQGKKYINFTDSYGITQQFPSGSDALNVLKQRDHNVVMLEVMELIDRISKKNSVQKIYPKNFSLELHVRQTVITKVFALLTKKGLLKQDVEYYKLIRKVEDTDYGTIREKEKEKETDTKV